MQGHASKLTFLWGYWPPVLALPDLGDWKGLPVSWVIAVACTHGAEGWWACGKHAGLSAQPERSCVDNVASLFHHKEQLVPCHLGRASARTNESTFQVHGGQTGSTTSQCVCVCGGEDETLYRNQQCFSRFSFCSLPFSGRDCFIIEAMSSVKLTTYKFWLLYF